jgi:hypothetical protein
MFNSFIIPIAGRDLAATGNTEPIDALSPRGSNVKHDGESIGGKGSDVQNSEWVSGSWMDKG